MLKDLIYTLLDMVRANGGLICILGGWELLLGLLIGDIYLWDCMIWKNYPWIYIIGLWIALVPHLMARNFFTNKFVYLLASYSLLLVLIVASILKFFGK